MYRIIPNDPGKYHNVIVGPRYCFTKKSAKKLIDTFLDAGCETIKVEKLVRLYNDVFAWTDYDEDDSVCDYYYDRMNEGA